MKSDPYDNVSPIKRPLSDRADRLLKRIEFASDLMPVIDRDYVVKGWLDRGATGVMYGAANTGKSFLAIDLAHHVFEGRPWAGCRVQQGPVLYCAAEGGAMFANRLAARKARFAVLPGQLTLTGRNADTQALAETVAHLATVHGPFQLIVLDTMARVMGAADENAAPDIAQLVAACDHLRARTGAAVLLIHHSGKDAERGARGHSALRAAIDTEIQLSTGEAGARMARATKQRDLPTGAECEFTLELITLGMDRDGDPVTSCIVKHKGNARR
jgi:RecA-family ATPase